MTSSTTTSETARSPWARFAFPMAMAPFALLVVVRWGWYPPASAGDYAQYLLHALALSQGRPYGDIGYIYHPAAWTIGPPSYPPGLPLMLVPVVRLFGFSAPVLRLVAVLAVGLFAYLAYRRLARDVDVRVAAIAAGMTAFGFEVTLDALRPMSDAPFAALLWGTFVVVDRKGGWAWGRVATVTVLGFAAMAFRVAGVALVPALALYALVHRSRLGARPFVPPALWAVAGLGAVVSGAVDNPYGTGMPLSGLASPGHVAMLVGNYRYLLSEATLYPTGVDRVDDAYHAVAWLLAMLGTAFLLWGLRRSVVVPFTLAYVVMLLGVPVGDSRYAGPLLPLLTGGLVLGLARVLAFLGHRLHRDALQRGAMTIAAGACAVVVISALAREMRAAPGRTLEGDPDGEAMFAFLRSQPAARVMAGNPRVVAWRTGRPAMGFLQRTTPGQLVGIDEEHITHFVWQRPDISNCAQRIANEMVVRYPERFRLAWENATFRVYSVVPAARPFDGAFEPIIWSRSARFCAPSAER